MRRRRWAIGLGAAGLVAAATACHVPYDFGGAKGADLVGVSYGSDGSTRWYTPDSAEPVWETPASPYGADAAPGDWNDDGRWELAVAAPPGIVSSTGVVVDHPPVLPPDAGSTPCPPPFAMVTGNWDGKQGTELGWFISSVAEWQIEGNPPVRYGRPLADPAQCRAPFAFDVPVPADYDGDGTTDIAVYEVDTGLWKVHGRPDPIADLGVGVGIPAPADYDGDGDDDPALWIQDTSTLHIADGTAWTPPGDVDIATALPTPADYDGDGDDDPAIWDRHPVHGARYRIAGREPVAIGGGHPVTARHWAAIYLVSLTLAARG